MKPTKEGLAKLPEWAQWYIKGLEWRVRVLGTLSFGLGLLLLTLAIYHSFPR